MLTDAVRRERIAPEEVMAAVRASGGRSLEEVAAVVLETDGSLNVIPAAAAGPTSAMGNVAGSDDWG